MSQQELLNRVVAVLDAAGIAYMVTGSVASSLQGEPRATHDVDLVVAIPASAADRLVQAFPPPDFYLERESIVQAIAHRSMFNLVEVAEGNKVDFWVLTDEPFDQSRFARRETQRVGNARLQISRPEDTILMKLKWADMCGGSEKQFKDALRVYEVQFDRLDMKYLNTWAERLGVTPLWIRVTDEAKPV
jgi:hypothetical protein